MIVLPHFNPVAISVFGFAIYWYSLAYLAGLMLGYTLLKKMDKGQMSKKQDDNFMLYIVVGIILGGRLGYVFIYDPLYYIANPAQILNLRAGGMSFHGGLIGATLGVYFLCKRYKDSFFRLMDLVALVSPIGLFFGRFANFINGELYGRPTTTKIGMVFATDPEKLPRHPSQLYEATFEGIVLLVILYLVARSKLVKMHGIICSLFLILYGSFRFVIEYFRQPEITYGNITMGQVLCLVMISVGLLVLRLRSQKIASI
jgi:phosphatidylglycerol---prolipoprotein diacylglyceryl transferase